jgi:Flp pilus assembly protein TadD/energy-coupling factor transporter ATP-binding protein EcfA2
VEPEEQPVSIATHHYNPDWLSDDALVAGFIVRQDEFRFLRDELARAPLSGSVQHYLLIGLRGAGKTTLLKRLAVAIRRDENLADHLIALSFPEELYQVKDLADFWWAACEALVDELDRLGRGAEADALMDRADTGRSASRSGDQPANAGLTLLLDTCAQLQRRPVLLVDNLDLVFQRIDKTGRKLKDPHAPAYWALREALSTTTSPIVIGGSVRLSEPFTDYDKAFYDFFIPKRLGKLELAEVLKVLEHLADEQHAPEVKARLRTRPGRIEALYDLTGGNPRAIGLIFTLLRQGPNGRAVDDFERLMDITTPYYKARFEDLSEQAQVVMHGLAVRRPGEGSGLRFGHTAAEIGAHAGLATNIVSAQMDVLEREGLIEKSAAQGRTQYRIAEQLFRLWLQMRGTRRIRLSVLGLTEFLEAMYDTDELKAQLGGPSGATLSEARLAFAMADAPAAEPLRASLEAYGTDCVRQHLQDGEGELSEMLPACDLSAGLAILNELRDRFGQCGGELSLEEQEALLGAVDSRLEQKRASVDALCQPETAESETANIRQRIALERQRLLRDGMLETDLPQLYRLRARGYLPLPGLRPEDVEIACKSNREAPLRGMAWRLVGAWDRVKFSSEHDAQAWLNWGEQHAGKAGSTEWANVAGALRRSRQFDTARQVLEQAFLKGDSARAWYERGALLDKASRNPELAESAYRQAIALAPTDAMPWYGLGYLLAEQPEQLIEAEAGYRKAIELDPTWADPWNNLGNILAKQVDRISEAEAAYRTAIELDPTNALPWNGFGNILAKQADRISEAEAAYRKAVELDPTYAMPWHNLGNLLAKQADRISEAEGAYRKAIEMDPTDALPWNRLGNLLADQAGRISEAEAAYRKAIELDPILAHPWNNLGNILADQAGRISEAEVAYRKAIELDPTGTYPWNGLGNILADQAGRISEAEAAYRKAVRLDPEFGRAWGNLGLFLNKQMRSTEAEEAFSRAVATDKEYSVYWQAQLTESQTLRETMAARQSLASGSLSATREALGRILAGTDDIATALVSTAFVEAFLAPCLADAKQAALVLGLLHGLGYDKHARPLLLAFEAAAERRPELLEVLEPETRGAAKRMYERLSKASAEVPAA